jgi:uncharacterized protein (TIGR02284 family)
MIDTKVLTATLERLITSCTDSANGFAEASRDVKSDGLRRLLSDAAVQREQFVREFQIVAKAYGDTTPPATGTIAGTVHHGWMQLKAALTGGSENAILAACLSEEQSTHQAYRQALDLPLPEDVRTLIQRHLESVLRVSQSLVQWQQGVGRPQKIDPH